MSRDSCPFLYSSFSLLVEDSVEVVLTLEVGGVLTLDVGGGAMCGGGRAMYSGHISCSELTLEMCITSNHGCKLKADKQTRAKCFVQ